MLKLKLSGQLLDDKKVIKSEEFSAKITAVDIIKDARQKSSKIIQDAEKIYETEKKRGFETGIEEGKIEGSKLIFDLVEKSVKNMENFESDLIRIISEALKRILGEIGQEDLIVNLVKNALKVIRDQKRVIIRAQNTQATVLRNRINELDPNCTMKHIEIKSDNRLKENQCILETDFGIIDASLDTQLKAIEKVIEKSIR